MRIKLAGNFPSHKEAQILSKKTCRNVTTSARPVLGEVSQYEQNIWGREGEKKGSQELPVTCLKDIHPCCGGPGLLLLFLTKRKFSLSLQVSQRQQTLHKTSLTVCLPSSGCPHWDKCFPGFCGVLWRMTSSNWSMRQNSSEKNMQEKRTMKDCNHNAMPLSHAPEKTENKVYLIAR